MSFFKRSIMSITRRKFKSLLLFFSFFIFTLFITIAYTFTFAADKIEDTIKMQLGAKVSIRTNFSNDGIYNDHYYEELMNLYDIYENLNQDSKVIYSSYNLTTTSLSTKQLTYSRLIDLNKEYKAEEIEKNNVSFFGTNDCYLTSDISENIISLTEGRTFTKEEMEEGANVIIVSKDFYDVIYNYEKRNFEEVKIGDVVKFHLVIDEIRDGFERNAIYEEDYEFEIIGFFESDASFNKLNNTSGCTGNDCVNLRIYSPNKTVKKIIDRYVELNHLYDVDLAKWHEGTDISMPYKSYYPLFKLDSVDGINTFTSKAEDLFLKSNIEYEIISSNSEYESISDVVVFFKDTMILVWIGIVATFVILGLILYLFIHDRSKEIGILLALGENKTTIIKQFVLEIILVAILSVGSSLMIGNSIINDYSEKMIKNQITEISNSYGEDDMYGEDYGYNPITYNMDLKEKLVEKIELKLEIKTVFTIILTILIVTVISLFVPLYFIFKTDIKKVLL